MTEGNDMSTPPPPPPSGDPSDTPAIPSASSGAPLDYSSGAGYPNAYVGPAPDANAKQWGMISHISALVQLVSIPSIVGPLVVWLLKKNEHPFINDQGKEAVNFHITVLIAAVVLTPTICLAGLGIILLIALAIAALILSIVGGMKANEGIAYRYPWTLRLVK